MECSVELLHNAQNRITIWPRNSSSRNLPQECSTPVWKRQMHPMFIAALFTIAKIWKQPKCSWVDEWIKKRWYIYTVDYYSAIRKKQILSFTTTWMELEGIILSEISQVGKTSTKWFHSSVEYKNKEKTEWTKHQENHRTQAWTNSYERERDWGE